MSVNANEPDKHEGSPLLPLVEDRSGSAIYIVILTVGLNFVLYGFQTIMAVYIQFLGFDPTLARVLTSTFTSIAYLFALIGGFVADTYAGLFNTIVLGSVLMFGATGVLLAANVTFIEAASQSALVGLSFVGISVFVIGSGFTKSCTSAFMGEQFGPGQEDERTKYYSWYYLGIQFGSIVITVASPIIFDIRPWGPWSLFVILGGSMLISMPLFLSAKRKFNRRPPKGSVYTRVFRIIGSALHHRRLPHASWLDGAKIVYPEQEVEDVKTALRVLSIFLPLPFFWAIFFQMYSVWVFQAIEMNRYLGSWLLPAPVTISLNPLFDIVLIPLFASVLYPQLQRCGLTVTPLRKIAAGHVFTILALVVAGFVELGIANADWLPLPYANATTSIVTSSLAGPQTPVPLNTLMKDFSIFWIIPQYFLVSCAEILLSVTVYEFAYSQAPKSMKGLMSGLLMITIALGNALLALLQLINADRAVMDFAYAGGIGVVFLVFLLVARSYTYTEENVVETASSSDR